MSTLRADLLKLRQLKRVEQETYAEHEDAKKARQRHERKVLDRLQDEGMDGAKADESTFTPVRTIYAQVQDPEVFAIWAAENDPDLLRPQDPRQRELNALVRRCLDDESALPPGVGWYQKEYISIRTSAAAQ